MFENCRLARMSDGHYCIVRDLGLVKGGKGMKHHEVVVDFNRRGMMALLKRLLARSPKAEQASHDAPPEGVAARSGG
jgi:hypothetical protein